MSLRTAILNATFHNKLLYNLINSMMTEKAKKQQEEKEPMVNMEVILKENNLQLVETEFFRHKKNVSRVKDAQGKGLILKTGKIEPFQIQLFKTAKTIESRLCFKVPAIINQGEGWILLEEVRGKLLNNFYDSKTNWCVENSKKIADSFQLVIQELQKTRSFGKLLPEGQEWFFSRLNMWSKPIVDAGLIDFSLVQQLKKDFEAVISEKGKDFFGWFHGNIIGDHIIVSGEDIYLLDLHAVPRAGKGYHDFLRALDFIFLKTKNEDQVFNSIPGWIKQYLSDYNETEVKLVFAFRNIGILGWDILQHKAEEGQVNIENKKQLALKFINREY